MKRLALLLVCGLAGCVADQEDLSPTDAAPVLRADASPDAAPDTSAEDAAGTDGSQEDATIGGDGGLADASPVDAGAIDAGEPDSGAHQCGGFAGALCPSSGLFCDFTADDCGGSDSLGQCMPRPRGCPAIYRPVCACDGQTYGNECEAAVAGADVNIYGGCPAPMGTFSCGAGFCSLDFQYCRRAVSDVVGVPDSFRCEPLLRGCQSCDCIVDEPCIDTCFMDRGGGLRVTCHGG